MKSFMTLGSPNHPKTCVPTFFSQPGLPSPPSTIMPSIDEDFVTKNSTENYQLSLKPRKFGNEIFKERYWLLMMSPKVV